MANNWGIPKQLEDEIRARDIRCVYCNVEFTSNRNNRSTSPSWEHIINDASIVTRENIVLCCMGCNASKGQKDLKDWLNTPYAKNKNITYGTVSDIVKSHLNN